MKKQRVNSRGGFTLLEILLVVAAIGILAGIVIIAVNPGKQLGDTRNAQRKIDVNTVLNAVYQYSLDNNGVLPSTITTSPTEICKSTVSPTSSCGTYIDLSAITLNQKYIVSMPFDPASSTASSTGYQISKTANGRVTVTAPYAEQSSSISITR